MAGCFGSGFVVQVKIMLIILPDHFVCQVNDSLSHRILKTKFGWFFINAHYTCLITCMFNHNLSCCGSKYIVITDLRKIIKQLFIKDWIWFEVSSQSHCHFLIQRMTSFFHLFYILYHFYIYYIPFNKYGEREIYIYIYIETVLITCRNLKCNMSIGDPSPGVRKKWIGCAQCWN